MDEKLYARLLTMPRKNLVHLMWEALDNMQAYNGRTKMKCLTMVFNAKEIENKSGTVIGYKVPSRAKMLDYTETMSL